MTLRWLITGASGMLGRDLNAALAAQGEAVIPLSSAEIDITDAAAVISAAREHRPSVIINCAAYTKVDQAEVEERHATSVNGSAVEFLAEAANKVGALLVQISTDFVFDGTAQRPYDVNDRTGPISAYGRSKLLGEQAATIAEKHAIVRTAWLFGVHGPNFVEAIRRQVRLGNDLRVVDDQRGKPTYTPHLAEALIRIGRLAVDSPDGRGILHYADEPECSWYDFACEIVQAMGSDRKVKPVSSEEFVRPAKRPAYSVLSTERYESLTGAKPQSWREGLREYLDRRPE